MANIAPVAGRPRTDALGERPASDNIGLRRVKFMLVF
jgi:hypothetical protein